MNVFDIDDIKKIIFGFVYPTRVTKGMKIAVVRSAFYPFLTCREGVIHSIFKKKGKYVISLLNESTPRDTFWYKVYTYLLPDRGDVIKVIQYI